MTKRGCELWPRAPFCVSRFLSHARKDVLSDPVMAGNAEIAFALAEDIILPFMNWNVPQFVCNSK